MKVTTIGVDLAKAVFQVHGVNGAEKTAIQKRLRRNQVLRFIAQLPTCLIGMEACSSAHYWAREFQRLGHTAKLMAPQFVKPYVKANKTDVADAEAICEAVTRPTMRFVPIKSIEQHAVLSLHRARAGFVKSRTAQANQIRGLLGEFGIILPRGIVHVAKRIPEIIEDAENQLPVVFRQLLFRLCGFLLELDSQLLGISKRSDAYLRTLLVHGARSVVRVAQSKQTPTDRWTNEVGARRHMNVVSVARANKNARIAWALLAHKRDYDAEYKLAA